MRERKCVERHREWKETEFGKKRRSVCGETENEKINRKLKDAVEGGWEERMKKREERLIGGKSDR